MTRNQEGHSPSAMLELGMMGRPVPMDRRTEAYESRVEGVERRIEQLEKLLSQQMYPNNL